MLQTVGYERILIGNCIKQSCSYIHVEPIPVKQDWELCRIRDIQRLLALHPIQRPEPRVSAPNPKLAALAVVQSAMSNVSYI